MAVVQLDNKSLDTWPVFAPITSDIRITNNKIKEIPDSIGDLTSLVRIIMDNNQVTKISNKLVDLVNFIDLRLAGNKLEQIPDIIYNLKKLSVLFLNNNVINEIPPQIGELRNLTHLSLANNPIEYLPHSIQKLTKLVHLDVTGTKLPLPPGYNPATTIQATIDFILKNQKEPPPALFIKNAFLFSNLSKLSIVNKFNKVFDDFSEQHEVSFTQVSDLSAICDSTTIVLIVIGFDVHNNQKLVFSVIKQCILLNIPYKILYQKNIVDIDDIHLEKGPETKKVREQIEKTYNKDLISFTSMDELKVLVLNVLKEHKPEVIINSLKLVNIGHFKETTVSFDKQLTCIVGENGQGKSSILRALSLAIIGSENSKINKGSFNDLLRIESITKDGQINYCDSGSIILNYSVDSTNYYNTIILKPKDEGRLIEHTSSGDFQINAGDFNLKSLIVGFPQQRGRIDESGKNIKSSYSQPHVDDLIPLLDNSDDYRLDSFLDWIANLYGDAIKEKDYEKSSEYEIIEYVFEIISDLTGKNITFTTVQQFSPPIIIISSPASPNGIPLNLISQGFKVVIGWIGYFIQRRIEAFPLSSPRASSSEKSILIIDEIDSSIHPVWQSRLLNVLRDKFPSTQIICTTHSPLMLAGLNREQIQEIQKIDDTTIEVNANDFDTWATSYNDILRIIFNTSEAIPKYTKEELEKKLLELSDYPEKQKEVQEIINQLLENEMLVDDIKKYEVRLRTKELELDELIEEYKKKNQ